MATDDNGYDQDYDICLPIFEQIVKYLFEETGWILDHEEIDKDVSNQSDRPSSGLYILSCLNYLCSTKTDPIRDTKEYVTTYRLKFTLSILTEGLDLSI